MINLNLIKNIWSILVKAGLVVFVWTIMFIGAISIFSLVNKNTIYYGNRCSSVINEKAISYLNQEEIIKALRTAMHCEQLMVIFDEYKPKNLLNYFLETKCYDARS